MTTDEILQELLSYERKNIKYADTLDKLIKSIYEGHENELASIYGTINNFNESKPFKFSDYPQTASRIKKVIEGIASKTEIAILASTTAAWGLANVKNDTFVDLVFKGRLEANKIPTQYNSRNLDALQAFQNRKTQGMNLSKRVWNYTQQHKAEIELAFDVALLNGTPARTLAKDLKQYLNEPDKLFRRVRDKRGNLVLSKNAKAYNPGQGVYRSSYRNALRLARTETNMAYKQADYLRMQNLDFVVGFEVKRSNNKYDCDLCNSLKGKYPKDFKFRGWHPNCRCYVVSILATSEELDKLTDMILNEEDLTGFKSKNEVKGLHQGFNDYIKQNKDKILAAKSIPYFVADNVDFKSLKFAK